MLRLLFLRKERLLMNRKYCQGMFLIILKIQITQLLKLQYLGKIVNPLQRVDYLQVLKL